MRSTLLIAAVVAAGLFVAIAQQPATGPAASTTSASGPTPATSSVLPGMRAGRAYETASPDAKRLAYVTSAAEGEIMVIDGQKGSPYTMLGRPVFSSDSKRIAFTAQKGDKWHVVVDGKLSAAYDEVSDGLFSPDSSRLAYVAGKGDKQFLVVDDQEGDPFAEIQSDTVTFSPNSKRVACVVRKGKGFAMVCDGRVGEVFSAVDSPVFSPSSRRLAYKVYIGRQDAKQAVVVDGLPSEQYEQVESGPVFSPDSKQVAFAAKAGEKTSIYVNLKPQDKQYLGVSDLAYIPGGELAFVASAGARQYVVIAGQKGTTYDRIIPGTITFSPDGKHWAYIVEGDDLMVVLDGRDHKVSKAAKQCPLVVSDDGSVEYGVRIDGPNFKPEQYGETRHRIKPAATMPAASQERA